jgi:cell division protein FtsA
MKKKVFGKNVAAIDIGTTKIFVLIATTDLKGNLDIIGIGQHPSFGLKKGVVVNISMTVDSIKKAVKQAEEMAGVEVESACVGISGSHIQSFNSTGVVAIKGKEIKQSDIDRVIEAAKAIPIPKDQTVIHVLPQYFKVDGQEYVLDSLGMYGVRLEAQAHIITGSVASAQNIIKACELSGIQVSDIVLEQLASAHAVLTPYEKELGAGILDIGGGTSDFAIYKDGRIRHSKVIPIAGNLFTSDIAIGLGIPTQKAEELKKSHGTVSLEQIAILKQKALEIDLGFDGGMKSVQLDVAGEILRFRAQEVLDILIDELIQFKVKALMPAGLVITGGGGLLDGLKELAEETLDVPVRVGLPQGSVQYQIPDILKSPAYATGYGLLLYSIGQCGENEFFSTDKTALKRVFKKMKSWIYDLF